MLQCSKCVLSFSSQPELEDHLKTHKARFSCQICSKQTVSPYHLQQHMRVHSRKLNCPVCEKNISRTDNLVRHLTTAHGICKTIGSSLLKKRKDSDCQKMVTDVVPATSGSSKSSDDALSGMLLAIHQLNFIQETMTSVQYPSSNEPAPLTVDQVNMIARLAMQHRPDEDDVCSAPHSTAQGPNGGNATKY